jgi:transcriptional regulator with XRE-family HTH domain
MGTAAGRVVSPQTRGRELARQGRQLYQSLGSVKAAAAELMNRHRDLPSIQAFRYAAGLSQDQAALRYNEVADHQTALGGTSVNAWETWARGRGAGSPPSFSSLMILAIAYGRGPLGVSEEDISPGDLVAEAYERLPAEDQLSLKRFADARSSPSLYPHTAAVRSVETTTVTRGTPANTIGPDFPLTVPTVDHGNPEISVFPLPNPHPGQLLDLTWDTFGLGIERLARQIKNLGQRLDVDICFGINEAGLVMATFLASAQFSRCPIGYLKCNKVRDEITLNAASFYPPAPDSPTIVICDFEVKHADVVGFIAREIRSRYPGAELYFAVFGAMTKGSDLQVDSFDDLTGARIMRAADFAAVFIAATMAPPGIEPPLELR